VVKFEDLMERKVLAVWRGLLRFLQVDESFEPIRHFYNDTKEEQAARPVDESAVDRLRHLLADETRFYEKLFGSEPSKRVTLEELSASVAGQRLGGALSS
jgi:hypothetical protein